MPIEALKGAFHAMTRFLVIPFIITSLTSYRASADPQWDYSSNFVGWGAEVQYLRNGQGTGSPDGFARCMKVIADARAAGVSESYEVGAVAFDDILGKHKVALKDAHVVCDLYKQAQEAALAKASEAAQARAAEIARINAEAKEAGRKAEAPYVAAGFTGDRLRIVVGFQGLLQAVGGKTLSAMKDLKTAKIMFVLGQATDTHFWTLRRFEFKGDKLVGDTSEETVLRPGARAYR
jgi:hypothetical protein